MAASPKSDDTSGARSYMPHGATSVMPIRGGRTVRSLKAQVEINGHRLLGFAGFGVDGRGNYFRGSDRSMENRASPIQYEEITQARS
jgi:hypothetical protein